MKKSYSHAPLAILRRDGRYGGLGRIKPDMLTTQQLWYKILSYLDNIDIICRRKLRMGRMGDGGWEICDDLEVRPQPPCTIYSFGKVKDFSFDEDVSTLYKCHVYVFDRTLPQSKNISAMINFYPMGIGSRTSGLEHEMVHLREHLGHLNTRIDVIKMDVEGDEWTTIPNMVATGQLKDTNQFLLEYHLLDRNPDILVKYMKVLMMLEDLGFRKFYTHKNRWCPLQSSEYPAKMSYCIAVHYRKE